jgi:hypothetical protein
MYILYIIFQALLGYRKTLNVDPMALGGKFLPKRAITAPFAPCDLLIRPQIA